MVCHCVKRHCLTYGATNAIITDSEVALANASESTSNRQIHVRRNFPASLQNLPSDNEDHLELEKAGLTADCWACVSLDEMFCLRILAFFFRIYASTLIDFDMFSSINLVFSLLQQVSRE